MNHVPDYIIPHMMTGSYKWERVKTFLLYRFPDHKRNIARLSMEEKMEWYYTRDPKDMVFIGNDKSFQKFWFWHVLLPLKLKRLYFRVKNLEIFKKYKHITEIKPKMKKYCI